jgi:hypothetical protein
MRPVLRFGGSITAIGLLVVLLAAIATWVKHRREIDTVSDEQKIARSLEIIRTSSPSNHKVLKVLFYGQSITRSGWHNAVVEHWQQKYPNTVFVVQNRALGGFASQALVRTTEQDIAAFYPDLIIFHVYGDHHAYERIIRLFRSRTAADIIVQTDHGDVLPDPPCAEGLQLTLHRQPGCSGMVWVHQRIWGDEMSYHKIPAIAKKYGLAMEPQRGWWRDYMLRTHVEPSSMLVDEVHPNEKGKELIASFFNQYFDNLVARWNGDTEHNVISIPADAAASKDGQKIITFDGNRLELLASMPIANWPAVTIDGASSKETDGCYQVTRATPTASVPDWPAVRRITLLHDRTPEEWTVTITKISSDQKTFEFSVKGSTTGDEGSGSSAQNFVSKSGKVSIDADDWMIERAFEVKHIPLHTPFEVFWSVNYVCDGSPEVIRNGEEAIQYRYVLATGLPNASHIVKLQLSAGDLMNVTEFRAYNPPLQKD